MAFNLEFKITYDELAPSLQDMFKSLQSQITDNRNEITDINIDIEDIANEINNINQEITNIKNDITNIENDITKIENNIQNIKNTITDIENTITEIEGDITNIEETVNIIQGMTADGEHGQVVKIDKNSEQKGALFADDNFHEMLVFENDSEIEEFKKSYDYNVSMQEIFNTWQINILGNTNANACTKAISNFELDNSPNKVNTSTKDAWTYNGDSGTLVMSQNNSRYSMFISLDIYQANLELEIMCIPIDGNDDDCISIIFGYKQPSSSEFHTLEFGTGLNHNNQREPNVVSTFLSYDFCQPTYKYLVKNAWDNNLRNSASSKYFKMKISKTNNSIKCGRTRCYATESEAKNAVYYQEFTYNLPDSKPSDWTDAQWNNIREMFGESKIGYGTFSWNSSFKVLYSNSNLNGSIVYNLNTDTYQSYKDGKWIVSSDKVSDVIPYRVFLYNDYNDTLFFYYYKQTYCKIATSGGGVTEVINELVASGSEGQILKIHNNGITPDNNFRVLRVVDNDTDFNTESKQSINMSDVFNNWNRFTHSNKSNMENLGYNYNPAWSNYYDFKDGQNRTDDQSVDVRAKWSYNKDSNYIASNFNATIVSGFYNTVKNKDWYIECLVEQQLMDYQEINKYDDDPFGIMIGLITDSSNVQHSLILLRSNGYENQNNLLYSLVYDIGNSTYKIVQNFYSTVPREGSSTSSNNQVRLYLNKVNNSLTIKTSRFGKNPSINESYTVTWTLPSSKPSGWSQNMYDNIKSILAEAPIGFIVISNDCRFWITNSNLFEENMIYRLDTDEIYIYNNGSYVKSSDRVSDTIPFHSWLYNKTTKKLFNYAGKQNYTFIDH